MASEEMLSWLRSTITADLAQAKAADEASPGPWVNTGQDGLGDAWQIHGAPTGDTTWVYDRAAEESREVPELLRVATLKYDDGGGVWEKAAADHIVLQQPRDTIARCEAELKILDLHKPVDGYGRVEYRRLMDPGLVCEVCCFDWDGPLIGKYPCETLVALAAGRCHRPGFRPEWVDA